MPQLTLHREELKKRNRRKDWQKEDCEYIESIHQQHRNDPTIGLQTCVAMRVICDVDGTAGCVAVATNLMDMLRKIMNDHNRRRDILYEGLVAMTFCIQKAGAERIIVKTILEKANMESSCLKIRKEWTQRSRIGHKTLLCALNTSQ